MKQLSIAISLFLCCAISYAGSLALPHATTALVIGLGNDSCGSYVLALSRNGPNEEIEWGGEEFESMATTYVQWAAGFVSALNMAGRQLPRQVVPTDIDGMALWMKNYCSAKPDSSIADAAWHYADATLRPPR